MEKHDRGEAVSHDDIKKHRNDIIRLSQPISPAEPIELPVSIRADAAALSDAIGLGMHCTTQTLWSLWPPALVGSQMETVAAARALLLARISRHRR